MQKKKFSKNLRYSSSVFFDFCLFDVGDTKEQI